MMGAIIGVMLFMGILVFQVRLAQNRLRGLVLPFISVLLAGLTVYLYIEKFAWPAVSLLQLIAMILLTVSLFAIYFVSLFKYRNYDEDQKS